MMESRLENIEVKVSFTEDLLDELNRTVIRQQLEIEQLQRELRELRQQMQSAFPADAGGRHDEPPPHY